MYVCRFRQVVANIEMRLKEQRTLKTTLLEWQTKTLVTFIAATVPVEKGKKNPLADAAAKVGLNLDGPPPEEEPAGVGVQLPPGMSEQDYIFEHGNTKAEAKNRAGSLEALMGGMGSKLDGDNTVT